MIEGYVNNTLGSSNINYPYQLSQAVPIINNSNYHRNNEKQRQQLPNLTTNVSSINYTSPVATTSRNRNHQQQQQFSIPTVISDSNNFNIQHHYLQQQQLPQQHYSTSANIDNNNNFNNQLPMPRLLNSRRKLRANHNRSKGKKQLICIPLKGIQI